MLKFRSAAATESGGRWLPSGRHGPRGLRPGAAAVRAAPGQLRVEPSRHPIQCGSDRQRRRRMSVRTDSWPGGRVAAARRCAAVDRWRALLAAAAQFRLQLRRACWREGSQVAIAAHVSRPPNDCHAEHGGANASSAAPRQRHCGGSAAPGQSVTRCW